MRNGYNRSYTYRFTNPPKALLKARLDNIAIVPASMLGLKALWQTAANTLPQGGVLLCHSQQNTRQRKLLERVEESLKQEHSVILTAQRKPFYNREKRNPSPIAKDFRWA
jgi:esterase/lipase